MTNGDPIDIAITYQVKQPTQGLRVYFDLLDEGGDILIRSFHDEGDASPPHVQPGRYESVARVPSHLLAARDYEVRIRATIYNVRQCTGDGIGIPLQVRGSTGTNRAYPGEPVRAKLQPQIHWITKPAAQQ